jgi:hypothetical protein
MEFQQGKKAVLVVEGEGCRKSKHPTGAVRQGLSLVLPPSDEKSLEVLRVAMEPPINREASLRNQQPS